MKKVLLTVLIFSSLSPVFAQRELVPILDAFEAQLVTWCPTVNKYNFAIPDSVSSAFTWVCSLQPSIQRASRLVDGFTSDVNGFLASAAGDLVGMAADSLGWDTGGIDLKSIVTDSVNTIKTGVENGNFALAPFIGNVLAKVNAETIRHLLDKPPADASPTEKMVAAISRTDSGRIMSEITSLEQRSEQIMRAAEAGDVASLAQEMAATSLARGDEEQLVKRVTSPNPATKGTADKAEDAAFAAVSSRAAIQANAKMLTDFARQSAVGTANLVTAVKEASMQQTFTTQQLATLSQSIADQLIAEDNEWREDYYKELAESVIRAESVEAMFSGLGSLMKP